MARALEKYFGAVPDIDMEAQRAILSLSKARKVDWREVDTLIVRRSFTLAYVHFRARGEFVEATCPVCTQKRIFFAFAGSDQRVELRDQEEGRKLLGKKTEIAGRVEDWKEGAEPLLVVLHHE